MKEKKVTPTAEKNLIKTKLEPEKHLAQVAIEPAVNSAAVISSYSAFGEQNSQVLFETLRASIEQVTVKNDMSKPESMLMGQAEALQAIFVDLARRANNQEYIKNIERFLKLALKAQNQCRITLEALAMIKNPSVIYAHQANIAHGHQQINNNPVKYQQENKIEKNELLEMNNDQGMDFKTQTKASTVDQELVPMEEIDGAKNK